MRVLQLHAAYRQRGGEDAAVATEAALLRDAGHEVHTHAEPNPRTTLDATQRFAAAPWNPAAMRRIRELVTRLAPDVVHVHNTWFALSPSVLGAPTDLDVPTVMTLHNYRMLCAAATLFREGRPCTDCVGSHPWHAVAHRCYRGSRAQSAVAASTVLVQLRRARRHPDVSRFLALTEFGRQQHIAGGLPADRVELKSNSTGDPGPRPRPPSTSSTVVFVGRLSEDKGIRLLVEAFRWAPAGLELAVVGDGPLASELRSRAPDSVRFLGSRSPAQVTRLLLEARALVFPSLWYEGQGLVALEAAAAGLPVLLSDHGAMAELFAPDADGLLFPPGEVAGLHRALGRLDDDDFVDAHGAVTRRRFEERYTHRVALARLVEIYRAVITEQQDRR